MTRSSKSDVISVAIDATAIPPQYTGAGYYLSEVLKELSRNTEIELHIITKKLDGKRFRELAPQAEIHNITPNQTAQRLIFQLFRLGRFIDSLDVNIFHGPHYQIPLRMKTASVVTIHDMTFFSHAKYHTKLKTMFFRFAISNATKRAKRFICVSDSTAKDFLNRFSSKIDQNQIDVALLGFHKERFRDKDTVDGKTLQNDRKLLRSKGIPDKFIGFLGLIEPRKSVPVLIESFSQIAENNPGYFLVIAGAAGWDIEKTEKAIAESKFKDRIVLTGRLTDVEAESFYRSAEVFVYPSVYEGFGMPVLEAMACGTPTITTESSSLKEVAGDGAVLILPNRSDQLAEALSELLQSKKRREDLSKAGLKQAAKFSWENCAIAHIESYKKAISTSSNS